MLKVVLIGTGGFIGAICRYGLGAWISGMARESRFPYHTLAINLAGCFAFGLIWGIAASGSKEWDPGEGTRGFIFVGILGGFTTFSTFGHEIADLSRAGHGGLAAAYIAASVFGGSALAWAGHWLGHS